MNRFVYFFCIMTLLAQSPAWGTDRTSAPVPASSLSHCTTDSPGFQAMLKTFPPEEINAWFQDPEGNCSGCIDPRNPAKDPRTGYLLIESGKFSVWKQTGMNGVKAMLGQVIFMGEAVAQGLSYVPRLCEAAGAYIQSKGQKNLLADDARTLEIALKRQAFEGISAQDIDDEITSSCKTAVGKGRNLVGDDDSEFIFLQLERCQEMGFKFDAPTLDSLNLAFLRNKPSFTETALRLSVLNTVRLSSKELAKRYHAYGSFQPELSPEQSSAAAHGLNEILATLIGARLKQTVNGFACLPSPVRMVIEGSIIGNNVDPFFALKALKWVKGAQLLRATSEGVTAEKVIARDVLSAAKTEAVIQPKSWSLGELKNLGNYQSDDFFPESYLNELRQAGFTPRLKINYSSWEGKGHFAAFAKEGLLADPFARFDFWKGRAPGSVVIERLNISEPLGRAGKLHASQYAKGLPQAVGTSFKKALFAFFKKGGFKTLEAQTSQNYLVGSLYRKMLGGTQSVEGKVLSDYIARLYVISSKNFPLGLRVKDIDQFSGLIGDVNRAPVELGDLISVSSRPFRLDGKIGNQIREAGGEILTDPVSGKPIALDLKGHLIFLYPEGDGYRPLFWGELHRRHPDWMQVTVQLP